MASRRPLAEDHAHDKETDESSVSNSKYTKTDKVLWISSSSCSSSDEDVCDKAGTSSVPKRDVIFSPTAKRKKKVRRSANRRPVTFSDAAKVTKAVAPLQNDDFSRPENVFAERRPDDFQPRQVILDMIGKELEYSFYDGEVDLDTSPEYRVKHEDLEWVPVLLNIHFVKSQNDLWYKVPRWLNANAVSEASRFVNVGQLTRANLIRMTKLAVYTNNKIIIDEVGNAMTATDLVFPNLKFQCEWDKAKDVFLDPRKTGLLIKLVDATVGRHKCYALVQNILDALLFWCPLIHDVFVKNRREVSVWLRQLPPMFLECLLCPRQRKSGHTADVHMLVVLWVASFHKTSTRMSLLLESAPYSPYRMNNPFDMMAVDNLRTDANIKNLLKLSALPPGVCRQRTQLPANLPSIFTICPRGETYMRHQMTNATKLTVLPRTMQQQQQRGILACAGMHCLFACFEYDFLLAKCTRASMNADGIAAWSTMTMLPYVCRRPKMQMFCFFDRLLVFVGGPDARGSPVDQIDVLGERMTRMRAERYGLVYDVDQNAWFSFDTERRWSWSVSCKGKARKDSIELLTIGDELYANEKKLVRNVVAVGDVLRLTRNVEDTLLNARLDDHFVDLDATDVLDEVPLKHYDVAFVYDGDVDTLVVAYPYGMYTHRKGEWKIIRKENDFRIDNCLYNVHKESGIPRIIGFEKRDFWIPIFPCECDKSFEFFSYEEPSEDLLRKSVESGYSEKFETVAICNFEDDRALWPSCAIVPLNIATNCYEWMPKLS